MTSASPELWSLYALMLKSRLFEEAVARAWHAGLISGEMHLGTGEEGIVAGVLAHVQEGDALALDHRGTPPLIMRGVDAAAILREMLGQPDGLCGGMGGHMHLFSQAHLAASSGIVGAAGPTAVGFALAARYLRPGSLAVAFFGDAAINQGMLMESMNLAASWQLPVLFVCKDDRWGITTDSGAVTGGDIISRARGLGVAGASVDGRDVTAVYQTAGELITQIRDGGGPRLLHAACVHLDGHFLGYQMMRVVARPLREMPPITLPLTRSFLRRGGGRLKERWAGLKLVLQAMWATYRDPRKRRENDPLQVARRKLVGEDGRLRQLETDTQTWLNQTLASAGIEALP